MNLHGRSMLRPYHHEGHRVIGRVRTHHFSATSTFVPFVSFAVENGRLRSLTDQILNRQSKI